MNARKIARWNEPVLENRCGVQEVQLTMFVKNGDDHVNDHVNDYVNGYDELTERQRNIVKLIIEDNTISLDKMTMKIGVSKSTIQRDITAMKHIVRHVGADKDGHWEISK